MSPWVQRSAVSIPWWHLSGVTDFDTSFFVGVDFRLRVTEDGGLLVSSATDRALRVYDSQISRP